PKKKRSSALRLGDSGGSSASAPAVYESYSPGSQMATHGCWSSGIASSAPSPRAVRYLTGTVRRFLASSVCSKVPRKGTKAASASCFRAEVEEWEEPLHPCSLGANIPHFLPQCNPNCA